MKTLPSILRGSATNRARILALWLPALLLIWAPGLRALNPQKQIGQYGHDSWTTQRGLLGEAVYQILQTRDGYLWVRTSAGLSRFDGVRFVPMDAEIGVEPVKAICMSADGDLLIRTNTRTIVYKDRRFFDYLPPAPLPGGGINVIFESREHAVFIGSDAFIYQLDKTGHAHQLREKTALINAFVEDPSGKIWIGGARAVYAYEHGRISDPIPITAFGFGTLALAKDRSQRLWAGTGAGLYRLDGYDSTLKSAAQPGIPGPVTTVLEDRKGNLWAGTGTRGLFRLSGSSVSSLDTTAGLTDDNILSLLEDREGSLWIGTASGLDRLRDTSITTFTTREGLLSNNVHTALETHDGSLYVFCSGRGKGGSVVRIRNNQVTPFEKNAELPSPFGDALFESRDGSLWLGTIGGLSRYKNGRLTVYGGDGHFRNGFISAISEDDEGLIVSNDEDRAFHFQNGKVSPYRVHGFDTPFTYKNDYIFTIYTAPGGTLWFGTGQGLYRIARGQTPKQLLHESKQPQVDFTVTSIFDDHAGNLWLGGRTPGLIQFRIRDGRVTRYSKRDGLFDGYVTHILSDDRNRLWISTEDGIYLASRGDLNEFAEGKTHFVPARRFGIPDGMKTSAAAATTSQPGGARTRDGRLWFATFKGIAAIDPEHLLQNDLVPPVMIESVVADGVTQSLNGSLDITPGKKAIEFHYTALSFRVPERVHFKYQLEGYDQICVDAGTRRTAYYTNLPPGHYRFRVVASNDDGLWNGIGASIDIVLKPRFYQTAWFYTLCGALALLLLAVAHQRRTRLIRARAEHLGLVVAQRTAALEQSQRELEQIALYDALTTLPNRRKFTETFNTMRERTQRQGDGFSMLLIDFDKFKQINDTFGHDAGDAFLVEAAMRLRAAVRSSDCVARLGGDEFAILLAGDQRNLEQVCDRIVKSFAASIPFKSVQIVTSASVGVAVFPEHGSTQEELYKSADLALYEVKRQGRNAWRCFNPAIKINAAVSETAAVFSPS